MGSPARSPVRTSHWPLQRIYAPLDRVSAITVSSTHGSAAESGRARQRGRSRWVLTLAAPRGVAGNAIGAALEHQWGNLTLRAGLAPQPEGVGSLTGSRAFRAPATLSAAITAAYSKRLPRGFSAHVQSDYWRSLATHGRSLWESAQLSEARISAALARRVGRHEFALQGIWRSGLSGSLNVDGRAWSVAGAREAGAWLTWRAWQ